jgi:hypothetical protein
LIYIAQLEGFYQMFCVASCLASLSHFHMCKFFGFYIAVVEVSVLKCNSMSLDTWFLTF